MAARLWLELGSTMRDMRAAAGYSLRDVERDSTWTRGTCSQVENAKARPSRKLVDWYDVHFHADGLLLALYAEARAALPRDAAHAGPPADADDGDALDVLDCSVPAGQLVHVGESFDVSWHVRNSGRVAWRGRGVQRVGAHAGGRLITSRRSCPVPDADPGDNVTITASVTAPSTPGAVVAYWQLLNEHASGPAADTLLALLVLASTKAAPFAALFS